MFVGDYEKLAEQNENFRKVLATGKHSQIVAMSLLPGEDIGEEVHNDTDQIFFIVDGEATFVINGQASNVRDERVVMVVAGEKHNVTNAGAKMLKLLTVYAPAHHPDGTVHKTKADALAVGH